MPVALMFENPNGSQEQYDAAREKLGITEDNLPDGGLVHFAGPSPKGGWRVVEVWESQDDAQRFFDERLGPVLAEVGVDRGQPEVWQVHSILTR